MAANSAHPQRWQVQEAKQRFSEVLRAAALGEP
jgi:antitoxin (DNA-binding transcriptional repressor) of toxin-antitoxin stability system